MDLKGLKFSKMHGIGNDFPIIDESAGEVIPEADKAEACRFLCHRHFGVGGDTECLILTEAKLKCAVMVLDVSVILYTGKVF